MCYLGGSMPGETPHVQLVDDDILNRDFERAIAFPVILFMINQAAGFAAKPGPFLAPFPADQRPGIGVEEDIGSIIKMAAFLRGVGTNDAVAVAQAWRRTLQQNVPDIAGFMDCRVQGKHLGLLVMLAGQGDGQGYRVSMAGKERKINSLGSELNAKWERSAGQGLDSTFHYSLECLQYVDLKKWSDISVFFAYFNLQRRVHGPF